MRLLITGICGFAGSRIAKALQREFEGVEIFGIDNFLRPGSERNRAPLSALGIKVRHGDVRLASDWAELPRADWVIDAAAEPSVLAGVSGSTSPRQLVDINLGGTVEMLEYCRRQQAGFVLLSTSRVYSIPALAGLPMIVKAGGFELDTSQPLPAGVSGRGVEVEFSTRGPVSLYGATKLASEVLAAEYAYAFGLPGQVNRCGVLSGAGQFGTAAQGIFAYWINAYLRRRPLRYIGFEGTGQQARDVLHIDDLALLVAKQIRRGAPGGLYAVGGGKARTMSLKQLTAWCDGRFGAHAHGVVADPMPRPYDIPWFVTDARKVQEEFDWLPEISLDAMLTEIAEHAVAHPQWLEWSGA